MECNKEEAIRAKAIAVKKMEEKDFVGARKFATRAQQLHVDMKDIPQMIIVCDVHCAAQKKIYGGENDWYGILQVEPTVDEITIKKQYRKLALLLHPDKNQFAGAADAFKLIGEAQIVLLDNQRRIVYDNKYRASGKFQASNMATQRNNRHPSARAHPWFQNVNLGNAAPAPAPAPKPMNQQAQAQQQHKVQTQPTPNQNRPTFWTVCPFCAVKYEYYKELVNKPLICKSCNKRFTGFEANGPTNYSGTSSKASQKTESAMKKGQPSTVPQSIFNKRSPKPTKVGTKIFENVKSGSSLETKFTQANKKSNSTRIKRRDNSRNTTVNNRKKKKKKRNDSAGSSSDGSCNETESSTDSDEEEEDSVEELDDADDGDQVEQKSGHQSEQSLRRSSRSKQQVSYDDYMSDDEFGKPSKEMKSAGDDDVDFDDDENIDHDGVGPTTPLGGDCVVHDPDFNDFDSERTMEKFKVGQIWALYSDEDTLPKYYGIITKINTPPNSGLQMTWLTNMKSEDIIPWVNEEMPVTCGKFKVSRKTSQKYEDPGPFSHEVKAQPSKEKGVYDILPQKGDVWALYKGWNKNMSPEDLQICEYEIVEVLETDYKSSITVLILEHVKGYKSVFKPKKRGESEELTMQIPWSEMLRFSHQILAVRLSEEKEGTLRGFWELDTAALPVYHFL